ncbi:hypothetical protein RND81_03G236900 [Saponaria officinalis]|uniref:DUF7870 domain-containing protein n=1 Tax=Saponaria officinalis TaxID=3572 RepID=A0AAW1MBI3_SAPOF
MQLKNSNMELPYYDDSNSSNMHVLHGDYTSTFVYVRHYESMILKILAQAMVLAVLIMVLPGVVGASFRSNNQDDLSYNSNIELIARGEAFNSKSLSLILNDLASEGLLTSKDISLIVSQEQDIGSLENVKSLLIVSPLDLKQQRFISDETFDFSFTNCFAMVQVFIDRSLKLGGIIAVKLSQDPNLAFQVPSNYKIVYFRKFDDSTYIAMRKTTYAKTTTPSFSIRRKLLEFLSEEKKAVLRNLEDVLLEPPRSTTGKSKTYLRKTKFLPDLLNDSLEGYSRRVYIDVGGRGHGSTRWFKQNYPTRDKDFDMYRIETVPEAEVESDDAWEGPPTQMGISDWLWRNVKAEEYVVMKADAEVVEEMLKSKAIVLVDELFLECKPFGKGGRSKRAYWECLALYGRLRDFGVAVHQWWG